MTPDEMMLTDDVTTARAVHRLLFAHTALKYGVKPMNGGSPLTSEPCAWQMPVLDFKGGHAATDPAITGTLTLVQWYDGVTWQCFAARDADAAAVKAALQEIEASIPAYRADWNEGRSQPAPPTPTA